MKTAMNRQHIHQEGTKARKRRLALLGLWMMAVLLIICCFAAAAAADELDDAAAYPATPTDLRYERTPGAAEFVSETVQDGTATTETPIDNPKIEVNEPTLKEGEEPNADEKLAALADDYEPPKNAIQLAIDSALKSIDDNVTAVTVRSLPRY